MQEKYTEYDKINGCVRFLSSTFNVLFYNETVNMFVCLFGVETEIYLSNFHTVINLYFHSQARWTSGRSRRPAARARGTVRARTARAA